MVWENRSDLVAGSDETDGEWGGGGFRQFTLTTTERRTDLKFDGNNVIC